MPDTSAFAPTGKLSALNGTVNLATDEVLRVVLMHDYVFDAAHDFFDDVVASEMVADGYTHLGIPLTGSNLSLVTPNVKWDADDLIWTGTFHCNGAWIIVSRGGLHSADDLIAWIDFQEDKNSSADQFKIAWAAAGIATQS